MPQNNEWPCKCMRGNDNQRDCSWWIPGNGTSIVMVQANWKFCPICGTPNPKPQDEADKKFHADNDVHILGWVCKCGHGIIGIEDIYCGRCGTPKPKSSDEVELDEIFEKYSCIWPREKSLKDVIEIKQKLLKWKRDAE